MAARLDVEPPCVGPACLEDCEVDFEGELVDSLSGHALQANRVIRLRLQPANRLKCYDVVSLLRWLRTHNSEPETRIAFSAAQLQQIETHYQNLVDAGTIPEAEQLVEAAMELEDEDDDDDDDDMDDVVDSFLIGDLFHLQFLRAHNVQTRQLVIGQGLGNLDQLLDRHHLPRVTIRPHVLRSVILRCDTESYRWLQDVAETIYQLRIQVAAPGVRMNRRIAATLAATRYSTITEFSVENGHPWSLADVQLLLRSAPQLELIRMPRMANEADTLTLRNLVEDHGVTLELLPFTDAEEAFLPVAYYQLTQASLPALRGHIQNQSPIIRKIFIPVRLLSEVDQLDFQRLPNLRSIVFTGRRPRDAHLDWTFLRQRLNFVRHVEFRDLRFRPDRAIPILPTALVSLTIPHSRPWTAQDVQLIRRQCPQLTGIRTLDDYDIPERSLQRHGIRVFPPAHPENIGLIVGGNINVMRNGV